MHQKAKRLVKQSIRKQFPYHCEELQTAGTYEETSQQREITRERITWR